MADEPKAPAADAPAAAAPAAAPTSPVAPAKPAAPTAMAAPVAVAMAMATPAKATETAAAAPVLYTQLCQTCHAAGLANAPKLGDKVAWAPRLAQGIDGLTASAIKGKGAMPPNGGSTASQTEIKAVVTYMVSSVK